MNRAEMEKCMLVALNEAQIAASEEEVPVGAALFKNEQLLTKNHNRSVQNADMTAHAEFLCMQEAARQNGGRLYDCTLYVTLEPCAMCVGAAINLRVSRIVFGAYDSVSGACASVCDLSGIGLNKIETIGGILSTECEKLLRDFFSVKRCISDRICV